MTHLLIIEDRKDFTEILKDWVEAKAPDISAWKIQNCVFADKSHCESLIQSSDSIIFSISSDNYNYFNYFSKLYNQGKFDNKRIFLVSDSKAPELPFRDEVELHYCLENNFVEHCLDHLLNIQAS